MAIKKLSHCEDVVSKNLSYNLIRYTFGQIVLVFSYINSDFTSMQIDAKRVLREIIIMKNLVHENILNLQDVVYVPRDG